MKKPRITLNYLKDWINERWKQEGIGYRVTEIYRTNFTSDQYEGGAARLIIRFTDNELERISKTFYCFDTIGYLNQCVKEGDELYLKYDEGHYLVNTVLTTRKATAK